MQRENKAEFEVDEKVKDIYQKIQLKNRLSVFKSRKAEKSAVVSFSLESLSK